MNDMDNFNNPIDNTEDAPEAIPDQPVEAASASTPQPPAAPPAPVAPPLPASPPEDPMREAERLERLGGEPAPAITPEEFARLQKAGQVHIDARGRVRTARRNESEAGVSLRKRRAWYK
jgi:hypothetical protein